MFESRSPENLVLYAGVGPDLIPYKVNVKDATLVRGEGVRLLANVQYAVQHASGRYLYVTSSDRDKRNSGNTHHVTAFRIAPGSGKLTALGTPVPLPDRPIDHTMDADSSHLLIAFSDPAGLRVYGVNADGTIDGEVAQAEPVDHGYYPHQIRLDADRSLAILVTRGNRATAKRSEDPGALKVFSYKDGQLKREYSIAPSGGYGFGPRNLDFHPTQPWIYISLERQNKLVMFKFRDGVLSENPRFLLETLSDPQKARDRQLVGTVHVHPNGRFVYVANRADATVEYAGRKIFAGGENNLAVYRIDPVTGEPVLIQHVDTHGIHCRTFQIDPSGRLLVAANIQPLLTRAGNAVQMLPACLSLFHIAEDGTLSFIHSYDVEAGENYLFWMGMATV